MWTPLRGVLSDSFFTVFWQPDHPDSSQRIPKHFLESYCHRALVCSSCVYRPKIKPYSRRLLFVNGRRLFLCLPGAFWFAYIPYTHLWTTRPHIQYWRPPLNWWGVPGNVLGTLYLYPASLCISGFVHFSFWYYVGQQCGILYFPDENQLLWVDLASILEAKLGCIALALILLAICLFPWTENAWIFSDRDHAFLYIFKQKHPYSSSKS